MWTARDGTLARTSPWLEGQRFSQWGKGPEASSSRGETRGAVGTQCLREGPFLIICGLRRSPAAPHTVCCGRDPGARSLQQVRQEPALPRPQGGRIPESPAQCAPNALCLLALVVRASPGVPPGLPFGQGQVGQEGGQRALDLVRLPAQGMLRRAVVRALPVEADVVGCGRRGGQQGLAT